MPIEWSGLAPELLLALDRRSGDPLHSHDLRRRVTLRHEPGSGAGTYPRDGAALMASVVVTLS